MSEILCSACHAENPAAARFCISCGNPLAPADHINCPRCKRPNSKDLVYCDHCGARLTASVPDRPDDDDNDDAVQPFSLPSRLPGDTGDLDPNNLPDWLKTGQWETPAAPDDGGTPDWLAEAQAAEDEDPLDWLHEELGGAKGSEAAKSDPGSGGPALFPDETEEVTLPAWLLEPEKRGKTFDKSKAASALTDWLQEGEQPPETPAQADAPAAQDDNDAAEAASDSSAAETETGDTGTLPEWLMDPPQADKRFDKSKAASALTDWFHEGASAGDDAAANEAPAGLEPAGMEPADSDSPPDWLVGMTGELRDASLQETGDQEADAEDDDALDLDLHGFTSFLSGQEPEKTGPADDGALDLDDELSAFANRIDSTAKEPELPPADHGVPDALSADDTLFADPPAAAESELSELAFADEHDADDGETDEIDLTGFTNWLSELSDDSGASSEPPAFALDDVVDDVAVDSLDALASAEAGSTDGTAANRNQDAVPPAEPPGDRPPDVEEDTATDFDFIEGDEDAIAPLPDWLAELAPSGTGALSPPEGTPADARPPAADAQEISDVVPDWLAELATGEGEVLPPAALPPAESSPADSSPDEDDSSGATAADESSMPDWLRSALPDELLTERRAFLTDEREDSADSLAAPLYEPDLSETSGSILSDRPTPPMDDVPADIVGAELPDWLENAVASAGDGEQHAFQSDLLPDVSYNDMPDWLAPSDDDFDSALEAALSVQGEELLPAMGGEWSEILTEAPAEDNVPAAQLQPAEIPAWLQALKPGENRADAIPEEAAETTGPLAGIRGAIDIEPIIALPRESSRTRLNGSIKELEQQSILLRQLAREESAPTIRVGLPRPSTFGAPARILIAILLLGAILVGLLLPSFFADLLNLVQPAAPAGVDDAFALVEAAAGRPVILAIDYTPAMAGELESQAAALLTHLADNGSPVLTISQSAAGTRLAQNVSDTYENVTALGYLPGEAVGIRQLSSCIGSDVLCDLLPFENSGASDAALIIVLTSERESLVAWLEQAATTVELPMLIGVTQGLAPVAETYAGGAGEPIAGLLAGGPATAAYEALLADGERLNGPAGELLQAQDLTRWLVLLLILTGNLFFLYGGRQKGPAPRRVRRAPSPKEPEQADE